MDDKEENWEEKMEAISDKLSEDIISTLNILANCEDKEKSQEYKDAKKLLKARINNLESNLHIEIDMERLEDCSKALSYIGIEIAEALKLIPTPEEQLEAIAIEDSAKENSIEEVIQKAENSKISENENIIQAEQEKYIEETTFEAKPSLWQRIKKSKVFRAATYVFRIKIRIELPDNALPEGNSENL